MVVGIEQKFTSIVIFGNERLVTVGDRITTKGGVVSVMVGIGLLGRVLSPLGLPLDDIKKTYYDKPRSFRFMPTWIFYWFT